MEPVAHLTAALAGRYTVEREIGRGGMATVYLARDLRHNRNVALKVLNPELGAVLGTERFFAEIQVTANLQHPNLLPLFDSGEADGLLYYVMPYVEGESLRAMIQREKQLPIDEAIHIASAVASALDYAHRHGVIHRDLKPENILLQDGQPLVADFGIALAVSNAGGNRITQTGLSLGTPQYMSPEQATGDRVIDGRTDIYSLAAVTYEMLVGEPPHDGKTSQAIIAKVLTDRPRSIRLARDTVPEHVETAVDRGLAKLPADRFHTAHEFAAALQGKSVAQTAAPTSIRVAPQSRVRGLIPWAVAAVALTLAALLAMRKPQRDETVVRYEMRLPAGGDFSASAVQPVAISRDGKYVAYVLRSENSGTRRIYLRSSDQIQAREIPGTENSANPAFSPDGSALAFFSSSTNQVLKVSLATGKVEVIAEGAGARGVSWSPSGWIVASAGGRLTKTPAIGGAPQPFTTIDSAGGETGKLNPVALSDGDLVLYTSNAMGGPANTRIGIGSLESGTSTILDVRGTQPLGILDGYLIYTNAAGTLLAAPIDVKARKVTGPSIALSDQAAVNATVALSYAQMANDGSLVYVSGAPRRRMALISPNGQTRLLGEPGSYTWPRFSPDGKRFAISVGPLSQRDVWLFELPSGPFTRFTNTGAINDRPEWSADGKALLFRSNRGPRNAIWSQSLNGGDAVQLYGRTESQIDEGVQSPDGAYLLVQRDSTGNGEVWYRGLRADTTTRQLVGGSGAYAARFSPDGKWFAYESSETGIAQVHVRPFPGAAFRVQVTLNGGTTPVWAPDGKRIYYVNDGQLMAAAITSTSPFTVGAHKPVLPRGYTFTQVHADYDVAPDGSILALQSPDESAQLVVVRNLAAELRARVKGTPR